MKVLYILGFNYTPPYTYYEPGPLEELNTFELLKRSIESVKKLITNDIIVCGDPNDIQKSQLMVNHKNIIFEPLTKDPFYKRFDIILDISEKYKEDILFVEYDVVFLVNPNINKLFFNVGLKDNEPTGDIIYVEYEKIEAIKKLYIYI